MSLPSLIEEVRVRRVIPTQGLQQILIAGLQISVKDFIPEHTINFMTPVQETRNVQLGFERSVRVKLPIKIKFRVFLVQLHHFTDSKSESQRCKETYSISV